MKVKSAVIAPNPTATPLKNDTNVLCAIKANIGPGGAASERPYNNPMMKRIAGFTEIFSNSINLNFRIRILKTKDKK